MKKIFCLILTAVLCVSFCMTAFAADQYSAYTHKTQGYSLEYPSDWLVLDTETVSAVLKDAGNQAAYANIDIEAYAQSITSSDMVMFMKADGDNMSVVSQYIGQAFSADALVKELAGALVNQYKQLMPGAEFIVEGDVFEIEGREFAYIMYSWNNGYTDVLGIQAMNCDSGSLFYFTLTCDDTENTVEFIRNFRLFEHMMETVEF